MLVLGILALILFIISLLVILYGKIYQVINNKRIIKENNNYVDDFDEFEFSIPINFKNSMPEEIQENLSNESINLIKENDVKKENKGCEVVNLLINKKSYVFLANGNKVKKNEHLKVRVEGKIYYALVTKENYKRDIKKLAIKPKKLIIVKEKEKNNNDLIIEYIPKKKTKNKVKNEN